MAIFKKCSKNQVIFQSMQYVNVKEPWKASKLLQAQLTTIRLYPRLLKNLHWIFSESSFFEDTLVNIKGVELRDFKYFKKDELAMISLILNKRIVPKLSAITFINCKFNVEIMEWFSQLIDKIGMADNICHQSRSQQSSDGSEMATKKSKKRAANETLMKINANKKKVMRQEFHGKSKKLRKTEIFHWMKQFALITFTAVIWKKAIKACQIPALIALNFMEKV